MRKRWVEIIEICGNCHGTGDKQYGICPLCDGSGEIRVQTTIEELARLITEAQAREGSES